MEEGGGESSKRDITHTKAAAAAGDDGGLGRLLRSTSRRRLCPICLERKEDVNKAPMVVVEEGEGGELARRSIIFFCFLHHTLTYIHGYDCLSKGDSKCGRRQRQR